MKNVIMIGIAGGSASGKTAIASYLQKAFDTSNSFQIIRMDDYYKCQDHLTMQQRYEVNYDHPFSFDMDLLVQHIHDLKNRQLIKKPIYDFVEHTRSSKTETISPCDVVVIEGLFCLEEESVRNLLDIKLFVDTPADVRLMRRLKRDIEERGRSLDSVITQYTNTVKVMHDLFVEPSKRYADLIIPEGAENQVALDLLQTKIHSILTK